MDSCINKENHLLTVVIPTLNSAATLDWTLASLCAADSLRVIVADSFSVDATLAICRKWNIQTITVPPGNMYAAINAGLRLATSDWLAYVNSDDWIFTAAYMEMLEASMNGSADIVYGPADYVDYAGRFLFSMKPPSGNTAPRVLRAGYLPFCQPAAIFRRETYQALNGFDERYRAASDFDFFCRAALDKRVFRRAALQPVAAFRLHEGQISSRKPNLDREEKALMRGTYKLGSRVTDRLAFRCWRASNFAWYAGRLIRTYELSGRITLKRSATAQNYGPPNVRQDR